MGIYHIGIIQTILWPELIPKLSVTLQDVEWCRYLWCMTFTATMFLGGVWHRNTR